MSDYEKEEISCYIDCVDEECKEDDILLLNNEACDRYCSEICKGD